VIRHPPQAPCCLVYRNLRCATRIHHFAGAEVAAKEILGESPSQKKTPYQTRLPKALAVKPEKHAPRSDLVGTFAGPTKSSQTPFRRSAKNPRKHSPPISRLRRVLTKSFAAFAGLLSAATKHCPEAAKRAHMPEIVISVRFAAFFVAADKLIHLSHHTDLVSKENRTSPPPNKDSSVLRRFR